jgi:hypothetical protein
MMETFMVENKIRGDAVRYANRLRSYLSGLEKIVRMMDNAETFEVYNILEKLLPHLCRIFKSEIAFVVDERRKIIKSTPEASLIGKIIPGVIEDELIKSNEDILVISDTKEYPSLQELYLDSIMVLKFLVQEKIVWIGVCNGKNEQESYLGEDKIFFNYIIKLFFSIYERIMKSEKSRVLKQYHAASISGNWADVARTSAELVEKYNDFNYLTDFLDAGLSEMIIKASLHQETSKPGRGKITDDNYNPGCFRVHISNEKEPLNDIISIKEHKRAALAGARGLLYDIFGGPDSNKGISIGTTALDQDWIEFIVAQTSWEKNGVENDFDCRVDWLRTQWLRIYYLAHSGRRHPKSQDGREMRSIYGATWRKTVNLIQEHLKGIPGNTAESGSITINSDWLLAFLAQNALLSRNLCEHYHLIKPETDESNKTNLLTGARFFEHLSRFILYNLHYIRFAHKEAEYDSKKDPDSKERFIRPPFADVPRSADSSLSDSIIFMISEYAYREIGVPRELLIFEKLKQQLNFELPLYAANEFYRDHCYHVIDVCLLGEFLLSCDTSNLEKKEDIFYNHKYPHRTKLLKNWYIAALCHDLGYVVERVEKLVSPIEKLKADGLIQFNQSLKEGLKKGKGELKENIDSLCSESDLGINIELKTQIAGRINALDHGIIGWLYLCHLLNKLHIKYSSVQPALSAILRHNLCEHDETIHQEPLSLLLILCDHLQEWGRPRVATEQLATGVLENMRFSPQESHFDRQVHLNQFSIKGMLFKKYKKQEMPGGICDRCINNALCDKEGICMRSWPSVREHGIKFHLVFRGDHEVDIEPVLSFLYFCRDFQCQKEPFGKYLFPIAIHFFHPLSTRQRFLDEAIPDLDIFEAFANKNEDAVYLCHWIECARKQKQGIEYKITDPSKDNTGENKTKTEEFIINLGQMGRPLTRELHDTLVKDFIKCKNDWRAEK